MATRASYLCWVNRLSRRNANDHRSSGYLVCYYRVRHADGYRNGWVRSAGILLPLIRDKHDRDVMVNSVAPVWGRERNPAGALAAGLFGAFLLAYAVITDAR